jgi:hypothetical protein
MRRSLLPPRGWQHGHALLQSSAALTTHAAVPMGASGLLDRLVNWEQRGIPAAAGTQDSKHFDLDRMRRLLQRLGDPHMQYLSVHVAGSKGVCKLIPNQRTRGGFHAQRPLLFLLSSLSHTGKGSTSIMITEALRAAGYRVGAYTSPHMHHVCERISVAPVGPVSGRIWCPSEFERLVEAHQREVSEAQEQEGGALSHFEVITALAFRSETGGVQGKPW